MRVYMKFFSAVYALAIYAFIFLPVVVLVVFSLQSTAFPIPPFTGPSTRWYEAVLNDPRLTSALFNSLAVAIISSLVAVALGFLSAWGFARFTLPGSACHARPHHPAAHRQLPHHRHGPPRHLQHGRCSRKSLSPPASAMW